jgi:MFS family permease
LKTTGPRLPFGIPPDLGVIAFAMFIWGLGEGLFIYFYPLSLQRWNMDPVQIGVVLSLIGVLMALVQVPAGYLSDRFGTRPLIRAALILGVVSALVMGFSRSMPVFVTGLMAYSLTSFIVAPLNSHITRIRGKWSVQRAVTFVAASVQVGGIAGPVLGGLIADMGNITIVFRYSAGLFLISTVLLFFIKRPELDEKPGTPAHISVSPLANPQFNWLLVIVIVSIFVMNLPTQLTSIYLQNVHHLSIQEIGLTGTIGNIGTAIIMLALGSLSAPAGMLAGQLMLATFSVLLWRGQNAAVFFVGYLFIGGTRLYRSMTLAFARPLVKASDTGFAYGLVETGNALAIILAPLAAGFLYNYKPDAVFIAALIGIAIAIALNLQLTKKKSERNLSPDKK